MAREDRSSLLPGLRRSLGLEEDAEEDRVCDVLDAAEEDILRYLNREELPEGCDGLLIELAALKYRAAESSAGGLKSESVAEGQLSQSESRFAPAELLDAQRTLLEGLAPRRRVCCGRCCRDDA